MMVWLLFIIDLMELFFYTKIGSIISIGDLPTTNIIEPKNHKKGETSFYVQKPNKVFFWSSNDLKNGIME